MLLWWEVKPEALVRALVHMVHMVRMVHMVQELLSFCVKGLGRVPALS